MVFRLFCLGPHVGNRIGVTEIRVRISHDSALSVSCLAGLHRIKLALDLQTLLIILASGNEVYCRVSLPLCHQWCRCWWCQLWCKRVRHSTAQYITAQHIHAKGSIDFFVKVLGQGTCFLHIKSTFCRRQIPTDFVLQIRPGNLGKICTRFRQSGPAYWGQYVSRFPAVFGGILLMPVDHNFCS